MDKIKLKELEKRIDRMEKMADKSPIKIRLEEPRKNKAEGFYLLITNGTTASYTKDEMIVPSSSLLVLDENNIKYTILQWKT